jgi:hypothetical protein
MMVGGAIGERERKNQVKRTKEQKGGRVKTRGCSRVKNQ